MRRRPSLHRIVFAALFARLVAIRAEAPTVGGRHHLAALVVEVHMIDLLDRAAGEPGLMFDQILEPGLGADRVVALHRLMPGPIGARPHRVNARQATDIAGNDPAGREQEARQRDDTAPARRCRIVRIAPQRIVVADPVRVMADLIARRLVAPRLQRVLDPHVQPASQRIQPFFGDVREQPVRIFAHAGSCLSRSRSTLRLTLPAGVFGKSATNATIRGYSCRLRRVRTKSWMSAASASSCGRSVTTKALTTWPRCGPARRSPPPHARRDDAAARPRSRSRSLSSRRK